MHRECSEAKNATDLRHEHLLFRAGTKLEETGFVFEDVTLQDVPEHCLTGTLFYSCPAHRVVSLGGGVTMGMFLDADVFKCLYQLINHAVTLLLF